MSRRGTDTGFLDFFMEMMPIRMGCLCLSLALLPGWVAAQAASPQRSYDEIRRQFKPGSGLKDRDPNVYVYNQAFARRFLMPPEWTAAALQGVDAMALRFVPDYQRCPSKAADQACLPAPPRCELDLYFDQVRHPLPWHPASSELFSDQYWSSASFIAAAAGQTALLDAAGEQALIEPGSNRPARWRFEQGDARPGQALKLVRYDQQLAPGMAMMTVTGDCQLGQALVLRTGTVEGDAGQSIRKIAVPAEWMQRVEFARRKASGPGTAAALRSGFTPRDPNIYVYTAEFARRHGLSPEWIDPNLKGVAAVAHRMMPDFPSCGWNGDPENCQHNRMRCEIDMYFDHRLDPLPWDTRFPAAMQNYLLDSAYFVPIGDPHWRLPKRAGDNPMITMMPFTDHVRETGMQWQSGFWNSSRHYGQGGMGLASYEQEVLPDMARIELGGHCAEPPDAIWLAVGHNLYHEKNKALRSFSLPAAWRDRVRKSIHKQKELEAAFYRREGKKAMETLRISPVRNHSLGDLLR